MIKLKGLREAARAIEAEVTAFARDAESIFNEEIQGLYNDISAKLESLGSHLEISRDGNYVEIYLPFHIGTNSKGRPNVSARKIHNPYWSEFQSQPFQDALAERGYTEIDPAPGQAIEPSHGEAPGVRIRAKLPDELIRRIKEG